MQSNSDERSCGLMLLFIQEHLKIMISITIKQLFPAIDQVDQHSTGHNKHADPIHLVLSGLKLPFLWLVHSTPYTKAV